MLYGNPHSQWADLEFFDSFIEDEWIECCSVPFELKEWQCPSSVLVLPLNKDFGYDSEDGTQLQTITESPKEWAYLREDSLQLENSYVEI